MIKNYILKYEKYSSLTSVMMIILATFLIGKPVETIEAFVIAFSSIMVVEGIISFVNYFTIDKTYRLTSFDLISGFLTLLCGIFTIIYRESLLEVLPVILGLWIIFSSLLKIQIAINFSSFSKSSLWLLLIELLMVLLGVVLIMNPFESVKALTMIAGVFLLISEVCSLTESLYILNTVKKL